MGNYWYIDRTLNIKSLCGKDYYNNLLSLEGAKDINELIDFLGIRGAGNPNAAVTHLRDLGLVETLPNRKNQKTDFFKAYIDSGISNETLCLILMLKRNSLKDGKNTIKPFVVIAKSLVEMLNNNMEPKINWTICSKYLMPIKSYVDEEYMSEFYEKGYWDAFLHIYIGDWLMYKINYGEAGYDTDNLLRLWSQEF